MKAVILAGGFGTRISEESHLKPKPMIEIGSHPILWHIMKNLYEQGITDFIICAGYKQDVIKEYFGEYYLHCSDITFDFSEQIRTTIHSTHSEKWKITVVDTGLNTLTGGRVKRVQKYLDDSPFLLTYGDGLSDVNLRELINFHNKHGKLATLTAVHPVGRFGVLDIDGKNAISSFGEKTECKTDWINGGFMILDPKVLNYIAGDDTTFEKEPLEKLSEEGELMAFKHDGFWQCMDTLRDKQKLESLWDSNEAPWKNWS